jgi:hypothetical protein
MAEKKFIRYVPIEAWGVGKDGHNSMDPTLGGTGMGLGSTDEDEIKVGPPARNPRTAPRIITRNGRYEVGSIIVTVSVPQVVRSGRVTYNSATRMMKFEDVGVRIMED